MRMKFVSTEEYSSSASGSEVALILSCVNSARVLTEIEQTLSLRMKEKRRRINATRISTFRRDTLDAWRMCDQSKGLTKTWN